MEANMALVGRGLPEMGRLPADEGRLPADVGRGGFPADPGREPGLVWLGLRMHTPSQTKKLDVLNIECHALWDLWV